MVGDSISAAYGIAEAEGWVELLRQRITAAGYPHRVINASITGDTTSGGRARIGAAFSKHQPAILVLELGGNDGLRGLSLKKMRNNLSAMVKHCKDLHCRAALLGMRIPDNYGRHYTERFYRSFETVANQHNAALVPFFLQGVATEPTLMQADQIHPNALAQQKLLDTAWTVIKPLLQTP